MDLATTPVVSPIGAPAASRTSSAPVTRRWLTPREDGRTLDEAFARELGVSPVLAGLLRRRGLTDPVAARAFLEPVLSHLHDPSLLPDMDKAAERLDRAIAAKEPILLYADYDVDGNSGAAILFDVLSTLGAVVSVHVPDRVKDGYGLKVGRLERAHADGVRVVVSIDSGVTAIEEARYCRSVGIDLVVTDHHTMKAELPDAHAVVHPRVPGSVYPNPHICGAGVAFKLAWAVAARRGAPGADGKRKPPQLLRDKLLSGLALVALGTVADVVALEGENRALVRYGLRALAHGASPGVRALCAVAQGDREKGDRLVVDATHIAFQLAPRLNAAGRMGDASRAFRLLASTSDAQALALAQELDRDNARRRGVQKDTTEAARAELARAYPQGLAPGLVVAGEGWPLGVVGIVAAKLVEDTRRPVLCLTIDGETAKGSGRSVPGIDLLRCLERCAPFLGAWGGHAAACGLTIPRDRLDAFRAAWTDSVAQELASAAPRADGSPAFGEAVLEIDLEVALADVHLELLAELDRLEPYGQGNRPPVLMARGLALAGEPRPMGLKGEHVAFFARQGTKALRVVAFSRPEVLEQLKARGANGPARALFDLAFRPRINRWNGTSSVELELEDVRFPG